MLRTRRIVLAVAILCLFVSTGAKAQQSESSAFETRFGRLGVNEDNQLTFRGQVVQPTVEGNSSLLISQVFRIGNAGGPERADVALVIDVGGTACPEKYYFVTVSQRGAVPSAMFGTCSTTTSIALVYGVGPEGSTEKIVVTMNGFATQFRPVAERQRAEHETHIYTYENPRAAGNGRVSEETRRH